ncbi:MAG: enoyl-CoA hydratase/isomerase family protein [Bdellovibrionales bacterium]|nr:enoyl-CoA hydratase/isomerase family protein [Bdellovibrionales bacterium]
MSDIIVKKEKFYYTVKLNRPEKHNAFTPETISELTEFFKMADKDKFAGAIVLSGEGKSFCAGGDLEWMKSAVDHTLKENMADSKKLFEMYEAAANCTLPVIGYLHGSVFGGGVGLAAICDIAVAEFDTRFCFSEVKLGLVPAVISSFVLKKMNMNKAKELMLTGEVFEAPEAMAAGLIEFSGRELEAKAYVESVLNNIGKNGREATREVKRLISQLRFSDEKSTKEESIKVISERRVSAEGQEGIKSFLEKRKPAWAWSMPDNE